VFGRCRNAPPALAARLLRRRLDPDALIGVPQGWTPDQIKQFRDYWDTEFSGDLARRRRARTIPFSREQSRIYVLALNACSVISVRLAVSRTPRSANSMMRSATVSVIMSCLTLSSSASQTAS